MDQRRLFLFVVLSIAFLIGWGKLMEHLHPRPPAQVARNDKQPAAPVDNVPADNALPEKAPAEKKEDKEIRPADASDDAESPAADRPREVPRHPDAPVVLGSDDKDSRYFLEVRLTSKGAAVEQISFSDKRYRRLDDPQEPLSIVGATGSTLRTMATTITPLDAALKARASDLNWELVGTVTDPDNPQITKAATYRFVSPDGLEITKIYRLEPGSASDRVARDSKPAPYLLHLDIQVKNTSESPRNVSYLMQGPVGVPLENADNARYHRGVRVGFLDESQKGTPMAQRTVKARGKTAKDIADAAAENGKPDDWVAPIRYIGVDEQYFAALVVPADELSTRTIASVWPQLISARTPASYSDISVQLRSVERTLEPGDAFTDSYALFAGPKRPELLASINAEAVQDFGWFGFVAKPMLWLLNAMHNTVGIPYGIAIVFLTIVVRGAMFPLSKKQTASAKMMKELQPKIVELKKKYGNDKEKLARAQMELFSKHNYNPFAGCLPILLQLPIFIGLYQALGNAVDLRLASFLWIDNLAAPDALFQLPGRVPIVGWTEFNLLPIVTIALFIVQQKMFMPPPTDEQSAMQQKMMKYMMIFMGFLFYRVPAGLCVYFIASALWGLAERKVLDMTTVAPSINDSEPDDRKPDRRDNGKKQPDKKEGLLSRLLAAADAAGTLQSQTGPGDKKSRPRR